MTNSPTISNAPLEHPGMDYAFLRQEGVKSIQQLAGSRWTDYNSHDPGITILEALCYAITDLSYRLAFTMEDLLAQPASKSAPDRLFLTAREILTVNPLTIIDYRKLLIDINGVKNAWLEPIYNPQPGLYYDASNAVLGFSRQSSTKPLRLKGLYRVLIEPDLAYHRKENDLDQKSKQALAAIANAKLQQHRNLCEDFAKLEVLGFEEITVKAVIEIAEAVNPKVLMEQIYTALANHISPSLPFLSLPTLLEQGKPVEDIFTGPILDHGFLDDNQVQKFDRKTELYTSDLIRIILDMPGVTAVKRITLSGSQANDQAWALNLNPQLTPRLQSLESAAGSIKFYKGQILCELEKQIKQPLAQPSTSQRLPASSLDLPIPTGNYRELSNYESVQSEFPVTYGIGEIGLPASASPERKAQAKQLQAYLMVFDQLLANYFAQLDHIKVLFSLDTTQILTYFSQSIAHFPGGKEVLKATYADYLKRSDAEKKVDQDRKNRLLEHLLAQYGETFTNHSLLYPTNPTLSDNFLKLKADFARDYRQVSAGRGQAFNYTRHPDDRKDSNVAGLKRRVARLLGIAPDRQPLASDNNKEGFYIVEHILLRPRKAPADSNNHDFLSFSQSITKFEQSNTSGRLTCTSSNHGLKAGDSIKIFDSSNYNGTYPVLPNPTADTFDIGKQFVGDDAGKAAKWVRSNQSPDPFSFQVSVVMPDWPARFSLPGVKQLIHDTLIAETPAHITLHIHWLNRVKMRDFEAIYTIWLQHLHRPETFQNETVAETSTRLIAFLKLGSTQIPLPPALIGYMTISQSASDNSTVNPFTVSPNPSG